MTQQRWWSPASTGLVLVAVSAAWAWRDCMFLALSTTLAYRLFLLYMERGAPWRELAAAVNALSAGLLAVGAGVALMGVIVVVLLGGWHPSAGHPAALLLMLIAGAAWCCQSRVGCKEVTAELQFWLFVLSGAVMANELYRNGWTVAPCLFVTVVGVALVRAGWRLATETAPAFLRAGANSR